MGVFTGLMPFGRGGCSRQDYDAAAGSMVEHLPRVGRWVPEHHIAVHLSTGARLYGFGMAPRFEIVERGRPEYSPVTRSITFSRPYMANGQIALALLAEELAHAIDHWQHGAVKYHHGPSWREIFRRLLEFYDVAPASEIEAAFGGLARSAR